MEIQEFINESTENRSQIWRAYDAAIKTEQSFQQRFSKKFNTNPSSPIMNPITDKGLPPEEVLQVIKELEKKADRISEFNSHIDKSKREISDYTNKIRKLEVQKKNLITFLSISGFVVPIAIVGCIFLVYSKSDDESSKVPQSFKLLDSINLAYSNY